MEMQVLEVLVLVSHEPVSFTGGLSPLTVEMNTQHATSISRELVSNPPQRFHDQEAD
jgi:hypothetical protein